MFVKVQKRSLLSNVTFNINVALGGKLSQTYGFFFTCFLDIFHLNQFVISSVAYAHYYPHPHHFWPTETVGCGGMGEIWINCANQISSDHK